MANVADLLSVEPSLRLDRAAMRQTLAFAFAAGTQADTFDRHLAAMRLPPSTWDAAQFSRDLFLADFVDRCLPIKALGRTYEGNAVYLARVIASPPRDESNVEMRRAIFRELLENKKFRTDLEEVYASICDLRAQISASRFVSPYLRRLEILRNIHAAFAVLAKSFEGAQSELSRVRTLGADVVEGAAYKRLDALLDHDAHLSTLDVRVRVGADGEVRTFQIVTVRENRANPFYSSAVGRFLSRLFLAFRGYRMSGGEVAERLFDDVFTSLEEYTMALFQLLADVEFYLGVLGLHDMAAAKGLAMCFPVEPSGNASVAIKRLFNPLLLDGKISPVPCDLNSDKSGSVIFVTGPNSGGKTRLLQAIAFAQMLSQVGALVPAEKAALSPVSGLFVSLVEEARSDQPEGQLGMELIRIRKMFEQLDVNSLVLLDELCSGTNPSEGEEIARLVISLLPELGAKVFVTTHLLSFASRLSTEASQAGLEFLQVELDSLDRPTYGFLPGVAKTSLAHKTAARLGVTREELSEIIARKRRRKS
ncbi:MAG: DNA mismatch repair protein [Polyangiaceae bacterium]|nr:DNA mismatch repair protein [Polyangiaceae bacterium]